MSVDEVNRRGWEDPVVVSGMALRTDITLQERAVLGAVAPDRRGARILELGVGGGRLAPALLEISGDYLGVDYSQTMIDICRRRLPGAAFEREDARELRPVPDGSVDLAVFGFAALDYCSHENRLATLRRVAAVLKPGGEVVLSCHNLGMRGFDAHRFPWPPLRRRPLEGLARVAAAAARRLRNRRLEVRTDGYAVVNEPEFDYRLLTYYVTIPEQRRQLREAGFAGEVTVFDMAGEKVAADAASLILYYRAFR